MKMGCNFLFDTLYSKCQKMALRWRGKHVRLRTLLPEDYDSDGCVTSEKVLDRSVLMHVLYSR